MVDEAAPLPDLEPHGGEQAEGLVAPTGGEEDAVARRRAGVRGQPGALGLGEVLGDRSAELAVVADEHVGQTPGAARAGPVLPGVELLARLGGAAGHHDGADVEVVGPPSGRLEDPERVSAK